MRPYIYLTSDKHISEKKNVAYFCLKKPYNNKICHLTKKNGVGPKQTVPRFKSSTGLKKASLLRILHVFLYYFHCYSSSTTTNTEERIRRYPMHDTPANPGS